jgi:exonuclease SbcD
MMKILHTGDIHLTGYQDDRWEVLLKLVEIGKQNEVELFTICGDLFDRGVDAESLRPQIRDVFSNTGFKVLIIPGNHDANSFKEGMYFGDDVLILGSEPVEYGDTMVVGLPFDPIHGEQLLRRIRDLERILAPDRKNILLCHGELLDAFFLRTCFGAEGEGRYMPFRLSYFDGLNVHYVLAGHFHSRFDVWQLKNGGYFVYPGSPISITKSETGQRKVNIFEVGEPPKQYLVDTPHYEEVTIELDPFKGESPLEIIKQRLEALHPQAKAILTIRGYVDSKKIQMSESEVVARSREIAEGKCTEPCYEFRDISSILESSLFKNFTNRVMEGDYSKEKVRQLQEVAIQAMMKAGL